MAYDAATGRGVLYRLDPDRTVLTGLTISNGMAWSDDGGTAYHVHSPTRRIDAHEYHADSGTFDTRRTLVEIAVGEGTPDGLTLDADDAIWVALWGGRAVRRYLADGTLDEVVELPVDQVSSCAFGGPDLTDLYITTSAQGHPADHGTAAGSLFHVRPGVAGVATLEFAG